MKWTADCGSRYADLSLLAANIINEISNLGAAGAFCFCAAVAFREQNGRKGGQEYSNNEKRIVSGFAGVSRTALRE